MVYQLKLAVLSAAYATAARDESLSLMVANSVSCGPIVSEPVDAVSEREAAAIVDYDYHVDGFIYMVQMKPEHIFRNATHGKAKNKTSMRGVAHQKHGVAHSEQRSPPATADRRTNVRRQTEAEKARERQKQGRQIQQQIDELIVKNNKKVAIEKDKAEETGWIWQPASFGVTLSKENHDTLSDQNNEEAEARERLSKQQQIDELMFIELSKQQQIDKMAAIEKSGQAEVSNHSAEAAAVRNITDAQPVTSRSAHRYGNESFLQSQTPKKLPPVDVSVGNGSNYYISDSLASLIPASFSLELVAEENDSMRYAVWLAAASIVMMMSWCFCAMAFNSQQLILGDRPLARLVYDPQGPLSARGPASARGAPFATRDAHSPRGTHPRRSQSPRRSPRLSGRAGRYHPDRLVGPIDALVSPPLVVRSPASPSANPPSENYRSPVTGGSHQQPTTWHQSWGAHDFSTDNEDDTPRQGRSVTSSCYPSPRPL